MRKKLATFYAVFRNRGWALVNTQIQRKQIIVLVLSIMLAVGSYWIPLRPSIPMFNPELPEMVTQSTPVKSGISAREPATAWRFW